MNMNILITTGIFPPDIGGPATYVPKVAEYLTKQGHRVVVLTLSDQLNHNDKIYPFKVIRIPRKIFKPLRWVYTIAKIIQIGIKVDILFVNGIAMETSLANIFLQKPVVQKVVGDLAWERAKTYGWITDNFESFQKKRYGLRIELLKTLRSWWTRQADRVIVPSQYLARWVASWGVPEGKIVVIYNAVEPVDGVEPLPVPLRTPIKAVTVGRLIPLKQVDRLIEALREIPELGLVVVGDGPERPRLERIAQELGVSGRVYFAGQRSKKETLSLMAACDFFVLNSTHEGLPHAVLEAMALGLPVIATAVGGTPEVVQDGETGVLFQKEEPSLIKTLKLLVNDRELRKRIGQAGYLLVSRHFRIEQMLRQTEILLLNLMERKNE
jgi:glycosyltransferase involved in cell wall biosynthesis